MSMNKKERLIITGSLIALWVIAKFNTAIAETLKSNDKKTNQSEQTTAVQQKTNNELNLDLMTPPDTIQHIKDMYYATVIQSEQERIEADEMRNNAMNSPYRDVTKELITMIYSVYGDKDKYNLFVFTTLLLDSKQQYPLSKEAYNIVNKDKLKTMLFDSLMRNFAISIDIKRLDKENANLAEILKWLEEIEKVYLQYINSHK